MRRISGIAWGQNKRSADFVPNEDLARFEVNNWELSNIVLNSIVPAVGVHPFPLNELMLLSGAVVRFKPRYILEWGTHIGKSARAFYETAAAVGLVLVIHSIDLPNDTDHVEHPGSSRGKLVRGLTNVILHQGDGLDTSLQILGTLEGDEQLGSTSLFFVDGDHSFNSVKRELSNIMMSAPKAKILLHDTFYQEEGSHYNVGPYRAIGECLRESPDKYHRIDSATGLPGMTLLYPTL
jgi:cephalosporin hydroxylase